MSPAETAKRGAQARQALDVLEPAMDAVKTAIVDALIKVSPEQTNRILALHAAIQATDAARQMITLFIANGDLAEHDLLTGE